MFLPHLWLLVIVPWAFLLVKTLSPPFGQLQMDNAGDTSLLMLRDAPFQSTNILMQDVFGLEAQANLLKEPSSWLEDVCDSRWTNFYNTKQYF